MNIIKHSALILAALLSAACARNQLAEINDSPAEREVEIRVDFRAPALPTSNAGRPLDSVDDLQKVTDVRLYFFRSAAADGTFTYYRPQYGSEKVDFLPVADFQNFDAAQGDETHTYQIRPLLPEGFYYRILAVGLSEDTEEGVTDPTQIQWTERVTTWGQAVAANKAAEKTGRMGESFTGIATDKVTGEEIFPVITGSTTLGFEAEVQLYRAVSGVLLYVTNVPAEVDGTPLTRIAILTSGYNTTFNPFTRQITADFVKTPAILAEIDVTNPLPEATFIAGNFLYPSRTFIPVPAPEEPAEGEEPAPLPAAEPSLLFAFYSGDSLTPFKTIPIKNVREPYDPDSDYMAGHEDDPDYEISVDGLQFNLLANHIYCLGIKGKDIDQPFDLTEALKDPDEKIFIMGCYQADIDIPM